MWLPLCLPPTLVPCSAAVERARVAQPPLQRHPGLVPLHGGARPGGPPRRLRVCPPYRQPRHRRDTPRCCCSRNTIVSLLPTLMPLQPAAVHDEFIWRWLTPMMRRCRTADVAAFRRDCSRSSAAALVRQEAAAGDAAFHAVGDHQYFLGL